MVMQSRDFWNNVDRSGGPDACWPWKLSKDTGGYGQLWLNSKLQRAHRVAFKLTKGVPKFNVLHTCDNPPCCNPDHVYDGTHKQNTRDMMRRGRDRFPKFVGSAHGRAVLDERKVRTIRQKKRPDWYYADKYGVSKSTVAMARLGYNWSHVT
jgi:hypothetical protein